MVHFDILSCAGLAFREVWAARQILIRAAIPVFVLKFLLQYVFISYFPDLSLLQQSLIRIPDFFLEGWLYIGFLYLLAHDDRSFSLPFGAEESHKKALKKQRLILSGVLLYILIQLLFNAALFLMLSNMPVIPSEGEVTLSPDKTFFILIMFFLVVGLFRYLWLFIPVGLGVPLSEYLGKSGGLLFSLRLFGLWLICILPISFFFFIITGAIAENHLANLPSAPTAIRLLVVALESVYEIFVGLLQVSAMFFAIFFTDQAQKRLS